MAFIPRMKGVSVFLEGVPSVPSMADRYNFFDCLLPSVQPRASRSRLKSFQGFKHLRHGTPRRLRHKPDSYTSTVSSLRILILP